MLNGQYEQAPDIDWTVSNLLFSAAGTAVHLLEDSIWLVTQLNCI